MFQLALGLIVTLLPITELRVGLPIVLEYAIRNNLSIPFWFSIVIILNILVIFLVFFFLDFFHERLLKFKFYKKKFEKCLKRIQKKIDKVENKTNNLGYFVLALFVAVPLPGTGAWTGVLIAWVLGLERLKSIIAISVGVLIAGTLILFATLGMLGFLGY